MKLWAKLFDGLHFNLGFFSFCSKAFSRIIFSILFRASNHQIVGKKYKTHVAEEWNFMHGYIPSWVLYVATTRCNASLRHYNSGLGKKRCNRPNWYKFLKLRHHTSRILSGREETNTNGGPKWRQISKTLKNHKKIMFCSNRKILSQKFLFQRVLSVKKRKFFRLWAL